MLEFLDSLQQTPLSVFVKEETVWGEPTILTLHTLGMMIVAGIACALSIRLLGVAPTLPVQPLSRLFPVVWWSFAVNVATGVVLLMADAANKLTNPDFYVKMAFVFAGVAILRLEQNVIAGGAESARTGAPGRTKLLAWLSLACWFGAITAGRLLAYTGRSGH